MESEKAAEPASKLDKRNAVSGVTFLEIKNKNLEDETVLTNEEISKHKNENDAWVVVDGIVYDISQFVQAHPGGAEVALFLNILFPSRILMCTTNVTVEYLYL